MLIWWMNIFSLQLQFFNITVHKWKTFVPRSLCTYNKSILISVGVTVTPVFLLMIALMSLLSLSTLIFIYDVINYLKTDLNCTYAAVSSCPHRCNPYIFGGLSTILFSHHIAQRLCCAKMLHPNKWVLLFHKRSLPSAIPYNVRGRFISWVCLNMALLMELSHTTSSMHTQRLNTLLGHNKLYFFCLEVWLYCHTHCWHHGVWLRSSVSSTLGVQTCLLTGYKSGDDW